jgi:hypothetical protein
MAPLTRNDLKDFLRSTGRSSPGIDRIQYDVLKYMCLDDELKTFDVEGIVLRLLNIIIGQQQMPNTMKQAFLISIHKSGDPLQFKNYRGISLLSCLFKVVTGSLNNRLQQILTETLGLDPNQGANRKGIHAAHKATVVMNVIADAKLNKKPLHIIYSNIKGASPGVPYQAFTDALRMLGLEGPFVNMIKDTQRDFTCTARGPTGISLPQAEHNGVHEGDCLSPTLFGLVLNMYFRWLRSRNLGYEMQSPAESPLNLRIKIPVNGYADDMALLGNSHDEVTEIFQMLERFLAYYGMELNASKCGYQYMEHREAPPPPAPQCRWGKIPLLHGKTSYKYLGY